MAWWSDTGRNRVDVDSVRLEPGAHRSPRDGLCLLELTSLVAEERFSDRPQCVCVVIAAFLRDWNDRSAHAHRQRLRPYARRVIGSKAGRGVTHRRRDVCLIWAGADLSGNRLSRMISRLAMRLRIVAFVGIRPALRLNEGAGRLAARVVFARYASETGLRLVDSLLEIGSEGDVDETADANGRDGDALTRAVVERAVRTPAPLPVGAATGNGHGNGNGNGNRPKSSSSGVAVVRVVGR
jgi:hypothetical protein